MDKETKIKIAVLYALLLFIIFIISPYLGIVKYEVVYNKTCSDGHVEWFNESTYQVCGEPNPLNLNNKNRYDDINYLDSFNLT